MAILNNQYNASSLGRAIAGGLVMSSLFDLLVQKGIITKSDARDVLQRALNVARGLPDTGIGSDASSVITDLLKFFSE
jgi:polyhydroxyalkanoate synthesis regulator phasin